MPYPYYILDVFASRAFGGNQLAVVLPEEDLHTAALQQIAAEFGFSETVFLYPGASLESPSRMRIFTPKQELPFAGHPTIGTSALLLLRPRVTQGSTRLQLAQPCGIVQVTGQVTSQVTGEPKDSGTAYTELTMPFLPEEAPCPVDSSILADLLQIEAFAIGFAGYAPRIVTAGPTFLFIPLRSVEALYSVRFNLQAWTRHLEKTSFSNVYVFAHEGGDTFHARMFAPNMGQPEDAATGAAAGGLAFYLNHDQAPAPHPHALIRQGLVLGRNSELRIQYETEAGVAPRIMIGGQSVLIASGELLAIPGVPDATGPAKNAQASGPPRG